MSDEITNVGYEHALTGDSKVTSYIGVMVTAPSDYIDTAILKAFDGKPLIQVKMPCCDSTYVWSYSSFPRKDFKCRCGKWDVVKYSEK